MGEPYYYTLAFGKRPRAELYDIRTDPECLENLVDQTGYADICAVLAKQLEAFLIQTGDPHILISPDYFDNMPLKSEETADYSWKAYLEGRWQKQPY